MTHSATPGPADDATVDQTPGEVTGLSGPQPTGDGQEREVGVTAAVERGPAETSSQGEPVREDRHASTEDEHQARSTDEL